jgi:hypothetical protein
MPPHGVPEAELYGSGVAPKYRRPARERPQGGVIIAMDASPSQYTVLDYGVRWGIENMFSDFKSRGFGLMQSHIKKPDYLERLILIMSIVLYWAISCGMFAEHQGAGDGSKWAAETSPTFIDLSVQIRPSLLTMLPHSRVADSPPLGILGIPMPPPLKIAGW